MRMGDGRRRWCSGLLSTALLTSGALGQVSLPHHEPFSYAPNSSLSQVSGDWASYWNPSGTPAVVAGASLGAPVGMPAAQGGRVSFAALSNAEDVELAHVSVSVNTLYYSFVCDLTPSPGDGFAIAMGGGGAHRGRLFVRDDAGGLRFGISKGEDTPEAEASFTVSPGEHFLVLKWQHGSPDVLSLSIDPDPTAPEPAPDVVATAGIEAGSISGFRLRQDASGPAGAVDELRMGLDWSSVTQADVALHGIFESSMVLQRGMTVPIWGTALDGLVIDVSIAGQQHQTVASGGSWRVDLDSMPAGGPHLMTVLGGGHVLQLADILVGDVWLCSGQSNMRFDLQDSVGGATAVAESTNSLLRVCELNSASADDPLAGLGADWAQSSPGSSAGFSAVAWYFGRRLQQDLAVPIGLIEATVSGTSIKTWMTNGSLLADPDFEPLSIEKATSTSSNKPTARYNGMIAPLQPFAIRGVIWYQGEADASKWSLYRKLFPNLIEHWRQDWEQGDFTFLFVQLASYGGLGSHLWPMLREAQLMTLSEARTGMVVTMDVGEADEIHPPDKQPVGARLALAARAVALGEPVLHSGPLAISARRLGAAALVQFQHTGGGLVAQGSSLKGFELAGSDQTFFPAHALLAGNTVWVASDLVSSPEWVRYGWDGFPVPEINLFNAEGLPASPFRILMREPATPVWMKKP